MTTQPTTDRRLGKVRAGARATLALGIGASLAANILAAQPTIIGRTIAAWPPVALLVTVELLSRVPVAPGWLSRLRVVAAAGIAGIAAWVSYWHMAAVALTYGEATVAAHLLPFSVDGLVVVASVCLVELGRPAPVTEAEPAGATATEPSARAERPTPRRRATPARAGGSGSKRAEVLRLVEQHPDWTQARIAQTAGCSVRTVRRHLTQPAPPEPTTATPPGLDLALATNGASPATEVTP